MYDRFNYANVQMVYDSVYENLILNKYYTFAISDIAFFERWYTEQTKEKQ